MTGKAILLTDVEHKPGAHQALYMLTPPLKQYCWHDEDEVCDCAKYKYVVVSGVNVFGEPETYIFGADGEGEIVSFVELPGSFKGEINHEKALDYAGYEIVLTY